MTSTFKNNTTSPPETGPGPMDAMSTSTLASPKAAPLQGDSVQGDNATTLDLSQFLQPPDVIHRLLKERKNPPGE